MPTCSPPFHTSRPIKPFRRNFTIILWRANIPIIASATSNPICFLFTRNRTTTHCDWCASALTASYSDDDLHGSRGLWAPRSENPDLEHPNLWLVRRGPPAAGLPAPSLFFFPVVVHRRGSRGVG